MMDHGFFMGLAGDGEKMNGIVGTNAENRSVAEVRGRADRGKTRTGRVVQCEVADTRVFEQMAVSPDTAWRLSLIHI